MVVELRRRGDALSRAYKVLDHYYVELMNSWFIGLAPVYGAATELNMLAEGFDGLSGGLYNFASEVENRKKEYARGREWLDAENTKVQRYRSFLEL